jgi:putative transposase
VKAGLKDNKAILLVIIRAPTEGRKVVLAVDSGERESKESWSAVLRNLRRRGLRPCRCTIADRHLGIWAALAEQQPMAADQRCWNHKIFDVPHAMPKAHQSAAKPLLRTILYAETQAEWE